MRALSKAKRACLRVFDEQGMRWLDPRQMVGLLAGGDPDQVRHHPSATAKTMKALARDGLLVCRKVTFRTEEEARTGFEFRQSRDMAASSALYGSGTR